MNHLGWHGARERASLTDCDSRSALYEYCGAHQSRESPAQQSRPGLPSSFLPPFLHSVLIPCRRPRRAARSSRLDLAAAMGAGFAFSLSSWTIAHTPIAAAEQSVFLTRGGRRAGDVVVASVEEKVYRFIQVSPPPFFPLRSPAIVTSSSPLLS